jgi:hypothetical protein
MKDRDMTVRFSAYNHGLDVVKWDSYKLTLCIYVHILLDNFQFTALHSLPKGV